jgi:hypothetical protein
VCTYPGRPPKNDQIPRHDVSSPSRVLFDMRTILRQVLKFGTSLHHVEKTTMTSGNYPPRSIAGRFTFSILFINHVVSLKDMREFPVEKYAFSCRHHFPRAAALGFTRLHLCRRFGCYALLHSVLRFHYPSIYLKYNVSL